jgi:hypothetical protein
MNKFRISQLAPLTGIVAMVLLLLGLIMVGLNEYLPSADQATAFLNNNAHLMGVWDYLGLLSSVFMVWFAGSLSSTLDTGEGDAGRLARIAFGGGLAAGIVVAITFATTVAAADRAASIGGVSPEQAITMYDLRSSLTGAALPVSLGLFAGAAGAAIIRSDRFPAWFGWLGIVAGLAAVSPFGYYLLIVAQVWIAVTSVWLFVRGLSAGTAAATAS